MIDPTAVRWSRPHETGSDRPVLLVLHGHGMTESIGFELHRELPDALDVAFLRGPMRRGGGYGWFPLDASVTTEQIEDSARYVLEWMDGAGLSAPVGILGFSQGACTALEAVRQAPGRFDYAVNLSGFVSPLAPDDAALQQRRLPALYARGSVDPLVPELVVGWTRRWMQANLRLTERVYPGLGHDVDPQELVDLSAFLSEQLAA